MSDQTPRPENENEVLDELRNLGKNLTSLLRGAWESEERKQFQHDLEIGINELRNNLSDLANSPTGQTIRQDIEGLGDRIRAGEVERAVRSEVLNALRMANEGLKKAAEKQSKSPEAGGTGSSGSSDEADSR